MGSRICTLSGGSNGALNEGHEDCKMIENVEILAECSGWCAKAAKSGVGEGETAMIDMDMTLMGAGVEFLVDEGLSPSHTDFSGLRSCDVVVMLAEPPPLKKIMKGPRPRLGPLDIPPAPKLPVNPSNILPPNWAPGVPFPKSLLDKLGKLDQAIKKNKGKMDERIRAGIKDVDKEVEKFNQMGAPQDKDSTVYGQSYGPSSTSGLKGCACIGKVKLGRARLGGVPVGEDPPSIKVIKRRRD